MNTFDLFRKRPNHSVWKGLAAGLIGGLAASWAANLLCRKLKQSRNRSHTNSSPNNERLLDQQKAAPAGLSTTISPAVFHQILAERERKVEAPVIRYALGSAIGGLYGATAEIAPKVTTGFGLSFATVIWLGADRIASRTFVRYRTRAKVPASSHLNIFVSHLVYGVTTEIVRRVVLRLLLSGFRLRL
jgi:uncharacterized membrane protein YagU involved in acid resistance